MYCDEIKRRKCRAFEIMKYFSLFLFITAPVFAESSFERELSQLGAQREREIATASEPINRRYKESLETLLRRATQANDLDTALKIREAIAAVGSGAPVVSLQRRQPAMHLPRWN